MVFQMRCNAKVVNHSGFVYGDLYQSVYFFVFLADLVCALEDEDGAGLINRESVDLRRAALFL